MFVQPLAKVSWNRNELEEKWNQGQTVDFVGKPTIGWRSDNWELKSTCENTRKTHWAEHLSKTQKTSTKGISAALVRLCNWALPLTSEQAGSGSPCAHVHAQDRFTYLHILYFWSPTTQNGTPATVCHDFPWKIMHMIFILMCQDSVRSRVNEFQWSCCISTVNVLKNHIL